MEYLVTCRPKLVSLLNFVSFLFKILPRATLDRHSHAVLLLPSGYMSLANNFITGSLPTEITNLALLDRLYVDGNYFEGTLPNNMGQLSNLDALSLYDNYFTGSIPDFGPITNLSESVQPALVVSSSLLD